MQILRQQRTGALYVCTGCVVRCFPVRLKSRAAALLVWCWGHNGYLMRRVPAQGKSNVVHSYLCPVPRMFHAGCITCRFWDQTLDQPLDQPQDPSLDPPWTRPWLHPLEPPLDPALDPSLDLYAVRAMKEFPLVPTIFCVLPIYRSRLRAFLASGNENI